MTTRTAILGYHYQDDTWYVVDFNIFNTLLSSHASDYERCQVGETYTCFCEAPVKTFTLHEDGSFELYIKDDFVYPKVKTLEESIQESKDKLRGWKL